MIYAMSPKGWQRTRLRFCIVGSQNGVWGSEPGADEIDVTCIRVADFDWERLSIKLRDPTIRSIPRSQFARLRLRPGDILLEKSGGGETTPVGRIVQFNQGVEAVCSNFVARVRPRSDHDSRFVAYLMAALYLSRYSHQFIKQNTGIQNLDSGALFDMAVWLPAIDTQKVIATFLDRETSRIDRLIEKKGWFSALADERWRSTLDNEIKGQTTERKRTPTKSSSFISELPEQWALTPLKHLVDLRRPVMYGIVLPGPNVDDGVLIVKGGDVKPGRLSPDTLCKTTREIEAGYARSRLRGGDLVIAIRGGIGDVEIVPPEIEGANLTQDAARIAPRRGVFNHWLRYALQAPSVFAPLAAGAQGAAVRGINIFDLDRVLIPTPPEAEQIFIAERLSAKEKEIRRMREKITEHAELIREFRSALITAAVTGQIDVVLWSKQGEADRRLDAIKESVA